MLVTYDEPPYCIKVRGHQENGATGMGTGGLGQLPFLAALRPEGRGEGQEARRAG